MQQTILRKKNLWAMVVTCLIAMTVQAGSLNDHKIYGRVETVLVTDHQIKVSVKMDTGAQTSSLSATHIQSFKKDGKEWIRFTLDPSHIEKGYQLELPLSRYIKIRKRHGEVSVAGEIESGKAFERRPVVKIPVCLGKKMEIIEVSLTDRSHFNYPMLMGRNAMEIFEVLIDPSLTFTVKPECKAAPSS